MKKVFGHASKVNQYRSGNRGLRLIALTCETLYDIIYVRAWRNRITREICIKTTGQRNLIIYGIEQMKHPIKVQKSLKDRNTKEKQLQHKETVKQEKGGLDIGTLANEWPTKLET